jgi:hypothetical protein
MNEGELLLQRHPAEQPIDPRITGYTGEDLRGCGMASEHLQQDGDAGKNYTPRKHLQNMPPTRDSGSGKIIRAIASGRGVTPYT